MTCYSPNPPLKFLRTWISRLFHNPEKRQYVLLLLLQLIQNRDLTFQINDNQSLQRLTISPKIPVPSFNSFKRELRKISSLRVIENTKEMYVGQTEMCTATEQWLVNSHIQKHHIRIIIHSGHKKRDWVDSSITTPLTQQYELCFFKDIATSRDVVLTHTHLQTH